MKPTNLNFSDSAERMRAALVVLLDQDTSPANMTEIAELLATGLRSRTFFRSGATGVLRARAQAAGLDPDPYVAILDQVPAKFGGAGWDAARAMAGDSGP